LEASDLLRINALRAAQGYAKSCHDFVEHQQGTVLGTQFAAPLHKWHAGAHKIHIACDRFNHQASEFFAVQRERFFKLGNMVVFQNQGVLDYFRRHTCAGGVAKGSKARPCFDQQRIRMAVVTAFEFNDLATTRGTACQA
jgi:hypothetical protein